jgi:hypothetical protein
MWAIERLAVMRTYTGDSEAALALLREARRRYPEDPNLLRTPAWLESEPARMEEALDKLRAAEPLLFRAVAEMRHPFPY